MVDQQHARACGQHREGGRDRRGGEGEDAREGESDSGARDGRVHQSPADLQLPRAAADGRGEGEHRARGLRGRGASGSGAGRFGLWQASRVADIVSTFDSPESVRLGECEKIEEVMIGEDKVLRFSGCKGGAACTIVLRGASSHLLEEAERSLHDALAILQQTLRHPERTLGGGCAEMAMAEAVDRLEPQVSGKKALAVAAFARALRQIPTILANNAGLDGVELTAQLRAAHHGGAKNAGLDM